MARFGLSSLWRQQILLFLSLTVLVGAVWGYRAISNAREYQDGVDFLMANQVDKAAEHFDRMAVTGDLNGLYGLAWTSFQQGNHDRAGFYADYLVEKTEGSLKAATYFLLGELDMTAGLLQRSRGRFRAAMTIYEAAGSGKGVFVSGLRLAEVSIYAGDPETSLTLLNELDQELASNDGNYWCILSQAVRDLGDTMLGLSHIQHAHSLFLSANDIGGQANALAEWGWQLLLFGDLDGGLEKTNEALELAATPKQEAYFNLNLVVYYRCIGADPNPIIERTEDIILTTSDKLLPRFLERAQNQPCER